jgi:hypothetical protein
MDSQPYMFMDGTYSGASYNSQCCGDNLIQFNELMTQPLSSVTTVEDFEYYLTSELIDVKNRQTISGYPTLRALYDRYISSLNYCGTKSSAFDYMTIDQFSDLVGNYWVDIIEQVVPSTTLWGSVKIYSNTIFDEQKFKYKSYSSLFCNNPFDGNNVLSPINETTGEFQDAEVIMTVINLPTNTTTCNTYSTPIVCNKIWVAQMNAGSEFIGTVNIVTVVCNLQVEVVIDYPTATAILVGAVTPVIFQWSNGDTGQTTTFSGNGNYSLTVTDSNNCSVTTNFNITVAS